MTLASDKPARDDEVAVVDEVPTATDDPPTEDAAPSAAPAAPASRDGRGLDMGDQSAGDATAGRSATEPDDAGGEQHPAHMSLKVSVRQCSLEHASYCLLVGHFQGLPLTGAESRLNERSEGRLERLLLMNQYPQRLGDMAILPPVDEAPPNGMAVIGLGPSGELTAAELRAAIARTVVRVALNELDRRLAVDAPPDQWPPLGVSSVLIGTSAGGGLSVEASVRSLVDGVTAANARLGRMKVIVGEEERPATSIVRIDHLELTERYDDRVDLIVGVLAQLKALRPDKDKSVPVPEPVVHYVLRPQRGEGASAANSPMDVAEEVWRRVDIRESGADDEPIVTMEFTSIGRLARAERVLESVERNLVDSLLTEAIDDHADPDISGTLYELLIPHELKGELGSSEHLHLLVDERTADVPWELLSPRCDDEERRIPVALRVGVLRQFREADRLRFDLRRASGNNVLVIGNPPVPNAPPLPGALAEAKRVADRFEEANWKVERLIWDANGRTVASGEQKPERVTPTEALHTLLNGDWRVVHIAAHGEFTGDAESTGVLLGSIKLTPHTFSKMSVVPDLVVLNCCHLGRVAAKRTLAGANRAAASVGRALLQLGVRAVVVAGWAVDDVAAEEFAATLAGGLLDGGHYGSAVMEARSAAHRKKPQSLTWGAYQCYGDPGFSLAPSPRRLDGIDVHTTGELRRRIGRLAATASDQGRSAAADSKLTHLAIREQLEFFETRAKVLGAPGLYADLAGVWGQLAEFDEAVRLYETALSVGNSDVPVGSIEQLGNLLSRRARRTALAGGDPERISSDLGSALAWLEMALQLGSSGERLALLGGHYKRAAAIATDPAEREAHLRQAIGYYMAAHAESGSDYHLLNCVQLVEVGRLHGWSVEPPPSEGEVDRGDAGLTLVAPAPKPLYPMTEAIPAASFWQRSLTGDRLLTAILVDVRKRRADTDGEQTVAAHWDQDVDTLVHDYIAAFRLRSSARERASVVEHLRDLSDLMPAGTAVTTSLTDARAKLERWPGSTRPGAG
jgi:hypothetical protein